MSNTNNSGFEYELDNTDPMGTFVEVYRTDEKGERGDLWLSIYTNTPEGETIEQAINVAKVELYDAIFCSEAGLKGKELVRQREALAWLEYAYPAVQDIKGVQS
jgi:hypothetical protein